MASPKASKEDQVQALFTKLAPLIKGQQHKKAVRTIDSILKLQPGDEDAVKCKVAVLLEGSSFQEALDYINALPANSFQFEQAYALYRLNQLQDSLQALAQNMPDTPAKSLLEAQLQHRLGNYTAAIATYNKLVQQHKVKSLEVGTNVVAAYVSGGRAHEVPAVMDALALKASDGFEIAFNQACADVAVGKLDAAEQQLLLAQRLGRETLYEDDVPEEEVEAELAPLTSQLAYVASRLGRSEEASTSYQDLLTKHQAEENVLAVVQNNFLALQSGTQSHQKRFAGEALKKFEGLMNSERPGQLQPGVEARLSEQQKQALHTNHALLLLLTNKSEACQLKLDLLKTRYLGSAALALVKASVLVKDGNLAAADKVLIGLQSDSPVISLQAVLMRAQIAVTNDDQAQAINILSDMTDKEVRHKPAVLATQLALQEQQPNLAGAISTVQEGLAWWQNSMTADKTEKATAQSWLQQQLVHLQLKAGDRQSASQSFQKLQSMDRTSAASAKMLGQLARASAQGNPQQALALQSNLPPLPKLTGINLDDLEAKVAGSRASKGVSKKRPSEADLADGAVREKKKRKRKPKLPKNFDPENPGPKPDPERWLPKWQRSDFKKKRNRRREKEAVKGSQGAGRVDNALDSTIEGNEPVAEASKPKGPARPAGAKGKKKGRR